jgi:hypothetical protein
VLLFGGYAKASPDVPSRPLGDTWAFAGNRWRKLSPTTSPAPRGGASCGWNGHELLLYGGSRQYGSTDLYGDTWAWTGADWSELHPTTTPGARAPAAFGYDGSELVLFGGWNPATSQRGDGRFDDTWIWREGTWQQEHDVVSPSPRSGSSSATWHGHGLLVNGGSAHIQLNDTWLHTSSGWQQLQAAGGNAPYAGIATTFGSDVLLYDGGYKHPTWLWRAGHWHQVQAAEPTQTFNTAITESGLDSAVMFGGYPPDMRTTFATTYVYRPPQGQPRPRPQPKQPPRSASPRPTTTRPTAHTPTESPRSSSAQPTPTGPSTPSPIVAASSRTDGSRSGRPLAVLLAVTAAAGNVVGRFRFRPSRHRA